MNDVVFDVVVGSLTDGGFTFNVPSVRRSSTTPILAGGHRNESLNEPRHIIV